MSKRYQGTNIAFFIVGIAIPMALYLVWSKGCFRLNRNQQSIDEAHDITVEDSFPASDPPSAW